MANTRCFNLDIPYPIFRLGEVVVEDLVSVGLTSDIDDEEIRAALERHVSLNKRALKEVLKPITESDYQSLNQEIDKVRRHIGREEHLRIKAFYGRGICQVLRMGRR